MAVQLDPIDLQRLVADHTDSVDQRRLLGALAAEPDRGFPLPKLLKYGPGDQLTLVLLMDELRCARLVQVVRVDGERRYRLAPVEGLAEMIDRSNRLAARRGHLGLSRPLIGRERGSGTAR